MKFEIGKIIVIAALLVSQLSFAQGVDVTGNVTDENGVPLPGVNIMVEGTSQGTQTDFDGNYSISVDKGRTLKFSFVGFNDYLVEVSDDTVINVSMGESANALDEVIVTAFGRTMTRNESTSSVSSVKSEELEKISVPDAREALEGNVTGLTMTRATGTPGAEPVIRIRGQNSITASNDPLYVVDGVPINSNVIKNGDGGATTLGVFSLINSSDIQEISVLKDASAVAPYGADGTNGVILITTKRGKKGKTTFSFSSSIGIINNAISGPSPMNADTKLKAMRESIWNAYGNGSFGNGSISSRDEIDDFMNQNIANHIEVWNSMGNPDYNWKKKLTNRNALISNLSFSAMKGDENSNFYASIGYNKTEGTTINTDLKRLTGSIAYGTKFGKRFDFDVSAYLGSAIQNGALELHSTASVNPRNLTYLMYAIPSWLTPYNEDGTYRFEGFSDHAGQTVNPVYTAEHDIHRKTYTRGLQNTKLKFEILEGLSFQTVLGLDFTLAYSKDYENPVHGFQASTRGSGDESSERAFNYTSQNSLDYNFSLDKHNFQVTALQEYTKFKNKIISASGEFFSSPNITNLSGTSRNWKNISTFTDQVKMRYIGLLNYNFDYKYILDMSFSYQGDSRFSEKWGSFYSIGAAWNMEKEDFLKNSSWIDNLRIKVGVGRTGNAGIGRNQYQSLIMYNQQYNSNPGSIIMNYGTSATWEKNNRVDLGMEFGLFHNNLYGSVGVYNNITKDMLLEVPEPYTSGFREGISLQNAGEMRNRGIEVELGGYVFNREKFKWDINLNLSTFDNKVTSLPEDASITESTHIVQEGHKINEWYLPTWAGVDENSGLPLWYVDDSKTETTSNYNEAKRQYQGSNPLPTLTGMLSSRVEFNNIFFELSFFYSGGNKIYDFKQTLLSPTAMSPTNHNTLQSTWDHAWKEPGDKGVTFPRWDYTDPQVRDFTQNSTRWLYDGDYIRMKDIAIGYMFPKAVIKNLGLHELNISLRGTNLWTWVKDKNLEWDPESGDQGIIHLATPPSKNIVFNLNLKF